MFDLLTEVQDGCKVPRLTIVDDHVAGTIDLVSFVAIATDACDAKLFQSAQTKDGIQTQEVVAFLRKFTSISLAFSVFRSGKKALPLSINVSYCSLSDCKMESQGTVVQQDQDTTKDYTIVKFEMSYLQQTMEKFTLQFLVDKAKRGKKRSSPPFESDRTLVLFRELQVRPVPTGYRTLFF
ncbi:unnamed protein product [Alternaria alternata]